MSKLPPLKASTDIYLRTKGKRSRHEKGHTSMDSPVGVLQIAIDGLVATGKSTVGLALAQRLGILYLDTGVMYRAVALAALEQRVNVSNEGACGKLTESLDLRLMPPTVQDGRQLTIFLNGRDVTWDIRTEQVNKVVPRVSSHPHVRKVLRLKQRDIAQEQSIVMVGRDITSIVLPNAQVKVLLVASLEERVRRRSEELARHMHTAIDLASLRQAILERDEQDTLQMQMTPDLHIVDTEGKSVERVIDDIQELIPTDLQVLRVEE